MKAPHPNEELLRREYGARARRDDAALAETFTDDVVWHDPGRSAISGVYRCRAEVMDYVQRRRALADETFEIAVEHVLADDIYGLVIASGRGTRGKFQEWRAHGLYRFRDGKIVECWVVPEDQEVFDEVWG